LLWLGLDRGDHEENIIAAILFAIAWIINATGTAGPAPRGYLTSSVAVRRWRDRSCPAARL
jgi:hypothetical protein